MMKWGLWDRGRWQENSGKRAVIPVPWAVAEPNQVRTAGFGWMSVH